ncbi:MAG TPA: Nramp family divalent metal transporter [Vicinamibacterales bacterium]|nr:Nramp family divalent metal transporter [Vicinamibacterales bacterium]
MTPSAPVPTGPDAVPRAAGEDRDPYRLRPEDVETPPSSLFAALRRTGPGVILAGAIVGSGELIATTTLGAQVGYVALWVILVSCIAKPVIQAEMGRYTIATGETSLEAFDRVPGPRARAGWLVWAWAVMVIVSLLQIGGMYGGVAQVMHLAVPAVSVRVWVVAWLALTLALLLGGSYRRIESLSMLQVALFTILTVLAAIVLMRMPQYFSWSDVWQGLAFDLPPQGLATAVAVFGITGVGATELVMYPYWCVEKGYARFTGACDDSAAWTARARGWIEVMRLDIIVSLVIYTVATVAFFLLGAGVLHAQGLVPASSDLIAILSRLYTGTLGEWAIWPFYAGAIATLYSTIFSATAAHARSFADLCRILGLFARDDYAARLRCQRALVVALCIVPVGMYFLIEAPVLMVILGGVAQALMLPLIGLGTIYLRHRRLPAAVAPGAFQTAALWGTTALCLAAMIYYAVLTASR